MRLTVQTIMEQIAASVNQEATMPTAGGAEYTLWLAYINRSIAEWAESHDWEELKKTYYPPITGISQATVPLPGDFKQFAGPVKHWGTGVTGGEDWPLILEEEASIYQPTAKYFYVRGDVSGGYNILWNPATLASGASISISYFSFPTSLASPAQTPIIPDSQFLVDRTTAYILEARSDPRFQEQETKARDKLLQMVERADTAKYNSYVNPVYVGSVNKRSGFRIGKN
jgi:hypothetical protein